ncbi:hypothetical protein GN244_ATG06552 [Phytophthora infestans]|uniref:M96 mating-specific protein family n=1 Tax=Phytophthora infestans TaxID=4787 RepID=A0A833T7M2_PHYIN|nr:hypothetical protein GN244_ATG06552 [Phytophthora infestans]
MDASLAALTQFLTEFSSSNDFVEDRNLGTLGPNDALPSSISTCPVIDDSCNPVQSGRSGPAPSPFSYYVVENKSIERRCEIRTKQTAKRQNRYLQKMKSERDAQAHANAAAASDLAVSAWRAAAVRQKERRLESEAAQQKLKARVAEQSQLIRSMSDILQQRAVQRPVNSLAVPPSNIAIVFKMFMNELNSLHAVTKEVIAGVDFKVSSLPMQVEMVWDWNHDMTFLESAHATIVPFGFQETCHALSDALLTKSSEDVYDNDIADPESTRAFKYHLDFSQELGESATLVIHIVVRRYVEAERVVFVSRALTEGQGDFKDLYTDETAWYVLRRATDASEGNALVLETYTRLMPVGFDLTSETDPRGSAFVKVLAKADEGDVDDIMVMFEQMLLDETQTICL